MAYAPIEPLDLSPRMLANSASWTTLIDNDAEVYAMYSPPVVQSQVAVSVTSGSYVEVLEWIVPQNEDDLTVRINVRWKVSGGGTADILAEMTDDAYVTVDDNTGSPTTTTSATETSATIDLVSSNSTGSATPRFVRLKLLTSAGTATITSVECYVLAATAATGTLAGGFKSTHTGWYSADEPVPSEVANRLINNPKRIAEDRPVTLVSVLDDVSATVSRAAYTTASTDGAEVLRFLMPPDPGGGPRAYRVAFRVERHANVTAHAAVVYIGPHQFVTTATGWTQETRVMGGDMFEALKCSVVLKVVTGTDDVYLRALQITREPT